MGYTKGTSLDEINQVASSKLQPVYFLWSDDDYLERYAIMRLTAAFDHLQNARVERFHFYGDEDEDSAFFDCLMTTGMFSPSKIILYRDVNKLESRYRKQLLAYLNHPSSQNLLVLTAPYEGRSKFLDELSSTKGVTTLRIWKPYPNQYKQVFRQLIADQGYQISPEALDLLISLTNDSLAHTMAEWEKILLYIGDRQQVNIQDVQVVVTRTKEYNIFDLMNAIARRDAEEAVKISLTLIQSDVSIPYIITQLYDLFANAWARNYLDLERLPKPKKELLTTIAANFNASRYGATFRALRQADLAFKSTNLKEELMVPLIYTIIGGKSN